MAMIRKSIPPLSADRDNPYLGLYEFKETDELFFHGRSRETAELLQLVKRGTLTVLYGMSGLGKTSLLRAGLFRRLRDARYLPIPIPLTFPAGETDLVTQIKAGVAHELAERQIDARPPGARETLWSYFHRTTFWDKTNHALMPALVFDQFEEIFTLGAGRPEVAGLLAALGDLIENRIPEPTQGHAGEEQESEDADEMPPSYDRPRVKVIFALREEYLPRLDDLQPIIRSIGLNRYRLRRMNGLQAREAVLEPARHIVEPDVAERIVRFVAASDEGARRRRVPGDNIGHPPPVEKDLEALEVEPALLSLVCRELNERRQRQSQPTITAELLTGESSRVLANFYERCVAGYGDQVRAFLEDRLLTDDDYRTTVALAVAVREPGMSGEIIDALVEQRLIRCEERLGIPHVELIHDRMITVLRDSQRRRLERKRRRARWASRFALLIGATVVPLLSYRYYAAQSREQSLKAAEQKSKREVAQAFQDGGRLALLNGDAATAARLLGEACRFAEESQSRAPALDILLSRSLHGLSAQVAVLAGSSAGPVLDARYSPDGKLIATLGADGIVTLFDASTGKFHGALRDQEEAGSEHKEANGSSCRMTPVTSIAWSKNSRLLTMTKNGCGAVWSTSQLNVMKGFNPKMSNPASLYWKRGSNRFAICDDTLCSILRLDESNEDIRAEEERSIRAYRGSDSYSRHIRTVGMAYGGRYMAIITYDNTARVWNLESGAEVTELEQDEAGDVAWSHDGKRFAVASNKRMIRVYEAEDSKEIASFPQIEKPRWIAFGNDNTRLVSVGTGGRTTVWNVQTGQPLLDLAYAGDTTFAAFSHDGHRVAMVGAGGALDVWSSAGVQTHALRTLTSRRRDRIAVDLAPDQDRMVTGGVDGLARIWDISKTTATPSERILSTGLSRADVPLKRLEAHPQRIETVAFNPSRPQMATGGWDGTARLISLGKTPMDANIESTPLEHEKDKAVSDVEYNADGTLVVTAGLDRTARVWDAATGKRLQILGLEEDYRVSRRAIFHPDGKRLATAGLAGRSCLWEARSGNRIRCFENPDHMSYAMSIAFGRNGTLIAVAHRDGTILLYNVESGRLVRRFEEYPLSVEDVEFNSAGDRLLAFSGNVARVWNLDGESDAGHVDLAHDGVVRSAHFGLEGRIVTSSEDRTAKIWDASGKLQHTLIGHAGSLIEATFDREGRFVLTASDDGTARLWNVDDGAPVAAFEGHPRGFLQARFIPGDGRSIVTADSSGDVRLWSIPPASGGHHGAVVQTLLAGDDSTAFTLDSEGCVVRWNVGASAAPPGSALCVDHVVAPGIVRGGSRVVVGGADGTLLVWPDLDGGAQRVRLSGISQPLRAVGLHAKDGRVMTVDARLRLGTWDLSNQAQLTDVPLLHQKPTGEIVDARFSADGERIVTACADGTMAEWDAKTFQQKWEFDGALGPLEGVALAERAGYVAGFGKTGLRAWRRTGDAGPAFQAHQYGIESIAISADGSRVAAGRDGFRLWDVESGKEILSSSQHMDNAHVAFDPTGSTLLSYDDARSPGVLWDAHTGARIAELQGPGSEPLVSASWSPSGERLVTIDQFNRIQVWDAHTGKSLYILQQNGRRPSASFGHENHIVVTTGSDRGTDSHAEIKVWNLQKTPPESKIITVDTPEVWSATIDPEGAKIAALMYADKDRETSRIAIWNQSGQEDVVLLPPVRDIIARVQWNHDGSRLLSMSRDRIPRVWDVGKKTLLHAFDSERVIASAFAPPGPRVVTGDAEGVVRVYGAASDGAPIVLPATKKRITAGALAPDGDGLAIGNEDGVITLWNVPQSSGTIISYGDGKDISHIVWSPEGMRFATANTDGKASVWGRGDGRLIATLSSHTESGKVAAIKSIRFNPQGNFVIAAFADGTARVWQTDDGALLAKLDGQTKQPWRPDAMPWRPDAMQFADFSSSGSIVLTGSDHGFIRLWDFHREGREPDEIKRLTLEAFPPRSDEL